MKTATIIFPCKLTDDHSPECVNKIIYKGDYKINFQGCEHCFEKHIVMDYIVEQRQNKDHSGSDCGHTI